MNANAGFLENNFAELMVPFVSHQNTCFAIATSGGPDSLCLEVLTASWARVHHHKVMALIVDHALRSESTCEADQVSKYLQDLDIDSVILTWKNHKLTSRIQESARLARYNLMLEWCHAHEYTHLLVGHHAQDQFETIVQRLQRGSTLWGLAGMADQIQKGQVKICRPLLNASKQQIMTTVKNLKLQPITDPSNQNEQFSRIIIRNRLHLMPSLPVKAFGSLRQSLIDWLNAFIHRHVTVSDHGYICIAHQQFLSLALCFQEIVLTHLLGVMTMRIYPPRRHSLSILIACLQSFYLKPKTLHGCTISLWQTNIIIARQWSECNQQIIPTKDRKFQTIWDDRFNLELNLRLLGEGPLKIASLGRLGWQTLSQSLPETVLTTIPYQARLALPMIWSTQTNMLVQSCLNMYDTLNPLCEIKFQLPKSIQCPNFLIRSCKS